MSSNEVSSGALYLVGVSSRYKLAPVGRGHIIIGNAITYSSSLHIEAGDFSTPAFVHSQPVSQSAARSAARGAWGVTRASFGEARRESSRGRTR